MTDYLTTTDIATMLRTSPETVRFWRHAGKGPKSFKVGRKVLYAREDVEAFVAKERSEGHHPKQLPPTNVRLGRTTPAKQNAAPGFLLCPHCGHGIDVQVVAQ